MTDTLTADRTAMPSSSIVVMVATLPTGVNGQSDDGGSDVGGIVAGCVVAFILIIAIVVCLIIFLIWYHAKKKREYTTKPAIGMIL